MDDGTTLTRVVVRDPCRHHLVTAVTDAVSGTVAAYAYDPVGNRLAATNNAVATLYASNPLNQYTNILRASAPPRETFPVYDPDGNMVSNGVWSYTWDAENRLVVAFSNATLVVSNAYDHAHRRVLKVTPDSTHAYLYDGWNLVQETIHSPQSTITNTFVWGKDLSGSFQGAGGVGGLLAVQMGGAWYFPFYDNNGNVLAYANETGTIVAEYTYDAFGRTIEATGLHADAFRHRFSTKHLDSETGLYYYGYRFYAPEAGRWMNRDPIEERGGLNLYGFVGNGPAGFVDGLGRWKGPDRNGDARAKVRGDCGDKVAELARAVRLNPSDFHRWLKDEDGEGVPLSADAPLTKPRLFSVPNTAYVVWGRVPEWWGAVVWWLNSQASAQYSQWKSEGLRTVGRMWVTSGTTMAHLGDTDLYRFAYFGHGAAGILVVDPGHPMDVLGPGRYTSHRVEAMVLVGCQTHDGEALWKENVSERGMLTTIRGFIDYLPHTPPWSFRHTYGVR